MHNILSSGTRETVCSSLSRGKNASLRKVKDNRWDLFFLRGPGTVSLYPISHVCVSLQRDGNKLIVFFFSISVNNCFYSLEGKYPILTGSIFFLVFFMIQNTHHSLIVMMKFSNCLIQK